MKRECIAAEASVAVEPKMEYEEISMSVVGLHRLHSVTAHRIAQPPEVTFVTRLQSSQLPS
jgi:hypothetical protein